jgi:hypothetical protein
VDPGRRFVCVCAVGSRSRAACAACGCRCSMGDVKSFLHAPALTEPVSKTNESAAARAPALVVVHRGGQLRGLCGVLRPAPRGNAVTSNDEGNTTVHRTPSRLACEPWRGGVSAEPAGRREESRVRRGVDLDGAGELE